MAEQLTFTERLDNISTELDAVLSESNTQLEAKGVEAVEALDDLPDAISQIQTGSGGASTWQELQNKPFSTVGAGLNVVDDELTADEYELPAATTSTLGGVKVGSGLSVTPDGTLSATGSGGSSDWSDVTNKPFESIGTGLKVEGGALKTTGGGGGQRGADWEAEEDEDGYIENKPFEAYFDNMPGLPRTYIDDLEISTDGNPLDNVPLTDEEWQTYTGIPKSNCYACAAFLVTFELSKNIFTALFGQPYPGDAAVIEEYGSLDAFGEYVASQLALELGLSYIYTHEFDYTPGQLPDISTLQDPVFSAAVNNIAVNNRPISINTDIMMQEMLAGTAVDVWGNTEIFNNMLDIVYKSIYSNYYMSMVSQISNPTNDDYYFAISKLSLMNRDLVYWIEFAASNTAYFTAESQQSTVTYTTKKSISGGSSITTTDNAQTHTEHFDLKDEETDLTVVYQVNVPSDVSNITGTIPSAAANGKVYSSDFKLLVDGQTVYSFSGEKRLYELDNEFSFDLTSGNHTIVIYLYYDESGSNDAYFDFVINKPEDVTMTFTELASADILVTTYIYSTSLDYTLTSAIAEIIKQIDNKFIPKPDWWFGEKKVIISEPTQILSNVGLLGGF